MRGTSVDPMDEWRIRIMRVHMRSTTGADVKAKHNAIASDDQSARKDYLLGAAKEIEWVEAEAIALRDTTAESIARIAAAATKANITL